jgi:hypothetical protein
MHCPAIKFILIPPKYYYHSIALAFHVSSFVTELMLLHVSTCALGLSNQNILNWQNMFACSFMRARQMQNVVSRGYDAQHLQFALSVWWLLVPTYL